MSSAFVSHSLEDTQTFAKQILTRLGEKTTLLFQGDLGSGKTTLAKALAHELGVTDVVTSPTFVIMKMYATQNPTFKRLVHVDLYRMDTVSDEQVRELGLLEFVQDPETLVVIEWPERLENSIDTALTVRCRFVDEKTREFTF